MASVNVYALPPEPAKFKAEDVTEVPDPVVVTAAGAPLPLADSEN